MHFVPCKTKNICDCEIGIGIFIILVGGTSKINFVLGHKIFGEFFPSIWERGLLCLSGGCRGRNPPDHRFLEDKKFLQSKPVRGPCHYQGSFINHVDS